MLELGREPQLTAATASVKHLHLFPSVAFPPPPSASPWFLFLEVLACWQGPCLPTAAYLHVRLLDGSSFLESRGGSPLSGGTRVGLMSPAEVKNLFFRLMSSGRNGGGGRQEGSAVSEGEPSPMTLTAALAPTVIPYQHGRGARGAAGTAWLCMGSCLRGRELGGRDVTVPGNCVSSQQSRISLGPLAVPSMAPWPSVGVMALDGAATQPPSLAESGFLAEVLGEPSQHRQAAASCHFCTEGADPLC